VSALDESFFSRHTSDLVSLVFGFTAALLEGLPIIGLVFTVSNRVAAAMWAHGVSSFAISRHQSSFRSADLEKRQHFVTEERLHCRRLSKTE